jgi:hypothetical protein
MHKQTGMRRRGRGWMSDQSRVGWQGHPVRKGKGRRWVDETFASFRGGAMIPGGVSHLGPRPSDEVSANTNRRRGSGPGARWARS